MSRRGLVLPTARLVRVLGWPLAVVGAVGLAAGSLRAEDRNEAAAQSRRVRELEPRLVAQLAGGLVIAGGTAAAEVDIELGSTVLARGGIGTIGATLRAPDAEVIATLNDLRFPAGANVFIPSRSLMVSLAADISATAMEIPLQAGQGESLPPFGIVIIEGEEISYTEVEGDVLIVAARGEPAAPHTAGTVVTSPTEVPECSKHPALEEFGKEVVFAFLPDGCTPRPLSCDADPGCELLGDCCCAGLRALMIGLADLRHVADGTPLYDCKVQAGETAGMFPLVCPEGVGVEPPFQPAQSGSSPLSKEPPAYETICSDATVTVSAGDGVHLIIGSTNVAVGGRATTDVTLHTLGNAVAAVRIDIGFDAGAAIAEKEMVETTLAADVSAEDLVLPVVDASGLPELGFVRIDDEILSYSSRTTDEIVVAARGELDSVAAPHLAGAPVLFLSTLPDCEPSQELVVAGFTAVFSYLPDGCSPGVDCLAVRAIVLPLGALAAVPDGTVLYSCGIEAGTAAGTFPLMCAMSEAASPPPIVSLPVVCEDGRAVVGNVATPTPTTVPATPTDTATPPAPTATPTETSSATPTPTPIPVLGDCDRDGCVVVGEVVLGVGVGLGQAALAECPAIDGNDDLTAGIDELVGSVGNSMEGCAP